MALIQAICNGCGANLEFDDTNGNIFCDKCGSKYIYERPVSININIGNTSEHDGWIMESHEDDVFKINDKKYAMPFSRDERQAKQDLLCKLIELDNVPLDIAYKTSITVSKEYYPLAFYDITSIADWEATSIWEHIEKYEVPREETIYIDYQGKEHKTPGQDTEVINNRVIHHNRRPMSRTVYDTKKRVVTDNIERTNGSVPPTTVPVKVWITEVDEKKISSTISQWIDANSDFVEINTDYFNDYNEIPEVKTIEESLEIAREYAEKEMSDVASGYVPGNRYEQFSISGEVLDVLLTYRYLSVYHIKYEYETKEYEYFVSGSLNDKKEYLLDHPVDKGIAAQIDKAQSEISNIKRIKWLWLLGAIFGPILVLLPIFVVVFLIVIALAGDSVIAGFVFIFIASIITAGWIAFALKKFFDCKKLVNAGEAKVKKYKENNIALKKRIFDYIQDDSISDDEKSAVIEGWINELKLNKVSA